MSNYHVAIRFKNIQSNPVSLVSLEILKKGKRWKVPTTQVGLALALFFIEYFLWRKCKIPGPYVFAGAARSSPPRTLMNEISGRGGIFKEDLGEAILPIFVQLIHKRRGKGAYPPRISINKKDLPTSNITVFAGKNNINKESSLIDLATKIANLWGKPQTEFFEKLNHLKKPPRPSSTITEKACCFGKRAAGWKSWMFLRLRQGKFSQFRWWGRSADNSRAATGEGSAALGPRAFAVS